MKKIIVFVMIIMSFITYGVEAVVYNEDSSMYFQKGKKTSYTGYGKTTIMGYSDLGTYEGNFKNGELIQGTWYLPDGGKYIGQFKNNNVYGEGIHCFSDGNKLVGKFIDVAKVEEGTLTFVNGDTYVGHFKNGLFDGKGIFIL